MREFTTVRDVGGPVFGLKRANDEGIVKGPLIYPSAAMITVTNGHGGPPNGAASAPGGFLWNVLGSGTGDATCEHFRKYGLTTTFKKRANTVENCSQSLSVDKHVAAGLHGVG
jgi:imidazolonepropionase-like amidohydrolase